MNKTISGTAHDISKGNWGASQGQVRVESDLQWKEMIWNGVTCPSYQSPFPPTLGID